MLNLHKKQMEKKSLYIYSHQIVNQSLTVSVQKDKSIGIQKKPGLFITGKVMKDLKKKNRKTSGIRRFKYDD